MNINIRAEKCCSQSCYSRNSSYTTVWQCKFAGGTGIGLSADIKKVFVLFPTDMTLIPATSNQLKNILHNIRKGCGVSFTAAGQFISDSILGEVVLVAGQGFHQLGNSLRLRACSTGHISGLNMPTLIQGLRGIPQSHQSQTTTLVPCQEGISFICISL